jgi:hypothetical protein
VAEEAMDVEEVELKEVNLKVNLEEVMARDNKDTLKTEKDEEDVTKEETRPDALKIKEVEVEGDKHKDEDKVGEPELDKDELKEDEITSNRELPEQKDISDKQAYGRHNRTLMYSGTFDNSLQVTLLVPLHHSNAVLTSKGKSELRNESNDNNLNHSNSRNNNSSRRSNSSNNNSKKPHRLSCEHLGVDVGQREARHPNNLSAHMRSKTTTTLRQLRRHRTRIDRRLFIRKMKAERTREHVSQTHHI